jgi:3-isopropylmalate/(R)-2-methylmalate dehydratase small subunit
MAFGHPPLELVVDLDAQNVSTPDGALRYPFDIDPFRKHCLMNGLDDVALTLAKSEAIRDFEAQHREAFPWLAIPL